MELSFTSGGQVLEARLQCEGEPSVLVSGKRGWYEVAVVTWKLEWKIRCEVSVTAVGPGYGYSQKETDYPHSATSHLLARMERKGDRLKLMFRLPDCLAPKSNSKTFGSSESWTVALSSGWYHCQARLKTEPGNSTALMRWAPAGLELCETRLGQTRVWSTIPRSIPRAATAGHQRG
jgi:hypothetical protein